MGNISEIKCPVFPPVRACGAAMKCPANEIFIQALELPEAARERFVVDACAGHPDLLREVRQMLKDAVRADEFFGETGGGDIPADSPPTDGGDPPD